MHETDNEAERAKRDGPRVTVALSASTRESDDYWRHRPTDHGPDGLFIGGPRGELSVLALLIGFTFCAVTASTPENERKQTVTYKARRVTNGGRYSREVKPATSGRKRKVA